VLSRSLCFLLSLSKQELAVFVLSLCLRHSIRQAARCPKYHRVGMSLFLILVLQIRLLSLKGQNLGTLRVCRLIQGFEPFLSICDQLCSCGVSWARLVLFSTVGLFQIIIIQGILYTASV